MQFVIVLTSVILVTAAIWLISRRMRVTGYKPSMIAGANAPEKLVDSIPLGGSSRFSADGVELGPVELVNGNSDVDSEQIAEELNGESEQGGQFDSYAELDPMDDVSELHEVADMVEYEDSFADQVDDSLEEVATDHVDFEETEIRPEFPTMDDSGPHFGEYSRKYSESDLVDKSANGTSQQTTLKLPESSYQACAKLQSDDSEDDKPIQTELEISVVFPDYRGSSDREIDVIGWLPGETDVIRRMDVLTIYRNLDFQLEPPHAIIGLDVDDGKWSNLEETDVMSKYTDLIFTMQLSYKGKPVSEKDWWKFSTMVESIANALSRQFHFSMTTDTVIREARLLNEQIWNFDLQAVLILKSDHGGQFSQKSIEYLAREYGLQERRGTTVYDRFDPGSSQQVPLFSIVPMNDGNVLLAKELWKDADMRTMILFSNLACVTNPRLAFDTMFDIAKDLEDRLAVRLIDQNHNVVNMHSISLIRSKIDEFIGHMAEYGITPGSEVALRLFESSSIVRNWAESQGVVSLIPEK